MVPCLQSLEHEGQQGVVSKPSSEWPSEGGIRFQNVTLRYRKGLPDVLKGVSFSINPRERLGMAAVSFEVKCIMGSHTCLNLCLISNTNFNELYISGLYVITQI